MTDLSPADRDTIERIQVEISAALGERVHGLALCGEAAGRDYRAGRSTLQVALVLDRVDAAALAAIQPLTSSWRRRRVATPLLFDVEYLRNAIDVFPLEILDLADRHVHLVGAVDPFAQPALTEVRLRRELEEQLRGKQLHLWESYLETTAPSRLGTILLDSLPFLFVLLRGVAFLFGRPRPTSSADLLREVEAACGFPLPQIRALEALRVGGLRLKSGDVQSVFGAYLAEVRVLVGAVDSRGE